MPETDLSLLQEAARRSGDIACRYFNRAPAVTHKPEGAGPVTEADLAVNQMLAEVLRKARPDYGWLSEETEDGSERLDTRHQFIVDPIDGTRAFINGSKDWAHSLAVVESGSPVAAVVYLPMHDAMFHATRGGGAFLNDAPISVSTAPAEGATVLCAKPNFDPAFWKDGTPPPMNRAFRSSLAYRLCLVAEGRFDGMLTLRPSWEWDIAAGALIVSEAGGIVTDQGGNPLHFNNPRPMVPGVLAGPRAIQAALASQLEPASSSA